MPDREGDPIADTGMFRAFVERGESEDGRGSTARWTRLFALVLLIAAVGIVGWLIFAG